MMLTVLLFAATLSSGGTATPIIIVVLLALLGSGGLGYFLDRRSAQASRLANDAVNATTVFQRSLDEERLRRTELERDLAEARAELTQAMSSAKANSTLIMGLHARIQALEADVIKTMQEMNETIRRIFLDDPATGLERWRKAMGESQLAVVQTDQGLTIVFISDEITTTLGYKSEDVLGHSVYEVISAKDHAKFRQAVREVTLSEIKQDIEPVRLDLMHSEGRAIPMLVAISPHEATLTLLLQQATEGLDPLMASEVLKGNA